MHAVNARLNQATREVRQRITGVDCDGPILRTYPLPLPFGVDYLQRSNGLSEKQCHRTQVSVAGRIEVADLLVLFGVARFVVHVPQMILAFDVVLVVADQLIFIWKFQEDDE